VDPCRIDKVIVFRTLNREHLGKILDIELDRVQRRILSTDPERIFGFHYTAAAKDFLLKEGTDPKYGARHLNRAIERHIVFPLSSLISTGQVYSGDTVTVDVSTDERSLVFTKEQIELASEGADGTESSPTAGDLPGRTLSGREFMCTAAAR
jgi:ATP-dependent Clp protease ATP-binding subunit ClpB